MKILDYKFNYRTYHENDTYHLNSIRIIYRCCPARTSVIEKFKNGRTKSYTVKHSGCSSAW